MKCPNCGGEIKGGNVCEYCGSQLSYEDRREYEQEIIEGCPECGSSNITFRRENQGELRGKNSKQIIHATVGLCKDCGCTWHIDDEYDHPKKKRTWLWVIGWICCFPIPLSILICRNQNIKPAIRYGIVAAMWIFLILWGISNRNSKKTVQTNTINNYAQTEQRNTQNKSNATGNAGNVNNNSNATNQTQTQQTAQISINDNIITLEDCIIKITDCKIIQPGETGNEYSDVPVVAFWYEVTNTTANKTINPSSPWIYNVHIIQDNNPNIVNELEISSLPDEQYLQTQMADIKPGGTQGNAEAYKLSDTETPVTIAIQDISGNECGRQTFQIK